MMESLNHAVMRTTTPRVFWFHLNKDRYRKTGKVSWTVHWNNRCIHADEIDCATRVRSCVRKRQPVAVMKGKTDMLVLNTVDGFTTLTIH